ncbi:RAQPRD family integrative conjugative element protein [Pseudomonas sp. App30]|uniref:integrative conjugative element protein, RAQPRD family n=1 Tax=Pseudomonas sp. App30 TaxID=3068990 RepID=UPI003A80B0B3
MTFLSMPRLCLFAVLLPLPALAQEGIQAHHLALIVKQLDAIAELSDRSKLTASAAGESRYRFDYGQLAQDLQLIRQGVNDYLTPSRAQPNELTQLSGSYRANEPAAGTSHEHD